MPKENWKSLALLGGVAALATAVLAYSLYGLWLLSWQGLAWCTGLLALTVAAGRFTVVVTNADEKGEERRSVADAFIFLAVMMYGAAPAVILAAVDGFGIFRRKKDFRSTLFSTGAAVVTTFLAALFYEALKSLLTSVEPSLGHSATLGLLLLPLYLLALGRYFLGMLAFAAYASLEEGQARFSLSLSRGGLVWALVTQVAGASSAALFYSASVGGGFTFLFFGLFIIVLVYLLYRLNEQRVEEIRRAQTEKLGHLQEMAELHMNTIESLAIAIDAKDQTTHGHVRRTQIYAMELGKLLGVKDSELEALKAGALLHDVGKLAVPEYILNKPGKLTAAEFEKMKIHTVVGGDIIKRVNFPYPVEDIVRFHHEKWDGTGYPKGLKGDDIPLVARIIAVVDFYDATRCDRPYRVGMKREDSLALLRRMAGTSFDPRVVDTFHQHIDYFDSLIADQDIQEQVASENEEMTNARPDAGLASDVLGAPDDASAFRSIAEAQREVFALHEIAQTIGSSLNLQDTVTLVSSKLRAIVPFDTCIIYIVDEKTGKAHPAHVAGEHPEIFSRRRVTIGEGISGWVIANGRSMCNTSPELDLVGVPEEVATAIKGVLVSPLIREDGTFGAITLYSTRRTSYTSEHVRLLESVSQHASSALNNAIMFEKTKESALVDPLTELPNARALHSMLEQRIAECQRLNRESLAIVSMDIDEFRNVNNTYGHGVGDRLLAIVADIIKKQMRQMDVLSRYAGDEFVAVMPMASQEVATMVAERIRMAVEAHKFPVRTGRTTQVGISIGVACFPADGETVANLLTAAERNMQRDKHARKLAPSVASAGEIVSIDAFR